MRHSASDRLRSWVRAAVVGGAAFVAGCASTAALNYPGHKTFTADNVTRPEVGMTPEEVKGIFGEPDEKYEMDFGADVGEAWKGHVWIYFTEVDKELKYVTRYKKSLFVFYPPGESMKLNHWMLEE